MFIKEKPDIHYITEKWETCASYQKMIHVNQTRQNRKFKDFT